MRRKRTRVDGRVDESTGKARENGSAIELEGKERESKERDGGETNFVELIMTVPRE